MSAHRETENACSESLLINTAWEITLQACLPARSEIKKPGKVVNSRERRGGVRNMNKTTGQLKKKIQLLEKASGSKGTLRVLHAKKLE